MVIMLIAGILQLITGAVNGYMYYLDRDKIDFLLSILYSLCGVLMIVGCLI